MNLFLIMVNMTMQLAHWKNYTSLLKMKVLARHLLATRRQHSSESLSEYLNSVKLLAKD